PHRRATTTGGSAPAHDRARLRAAPAARSRARCDNSRHRPGRGPGGHPGRPARRSGARFLIPVPTMPDSASQPPQPLPPSPFERFRHIVVEGPIGAGKTSLARRLIDSYGARPLLEDAAANPFLERYYREGRRHALPTQLFFLFQRAEQLRELSQRDLFAESIVGDFLLEKDPLFA